MLRTYLKDHPWLLVRAWQALSWLVERLGPGFERVGLERASRWVYWAETPFKRWLFDCRSCGQCVLHYTGMTCPMTCPKQLRNGPCGGVRADGKCEVYPDRDCVWVLALQRLEKTPYRREQFRVNPPVDWQLEGMASWVTHATGRDQVYLGADTEPRYADEVLT